MKKVIPKKVIPKKDPTLTEKIEKKQWFLDRPIEYYSWISEAQYISEEGKIYLLPNNKQFQNWINEYYRIYKLTNSMNNTCDTAGNGLYPPLFPYQEFVVKYQSPETPNRGILAYQGLGAGKTRIAAETAEQYRKIGVKILVFLPATLKPTWYSELKKWVPEFRRPSNYDQLDKLQQYLVDARIDEQINLSYYFISSNASNTLDIIDKINKGIFKHCFIIADEVHNFISMLVNPKSKKGSQLYHMLMNAIDCKFLFLSATPLLNFSFELGIMFNLLKGYMMYQGTKYTLFPEKEEEFEEYFVDYDTNKIKNPELFKKRIAGLVSYYYGAKGDVYPQLVIHPINEIPFSDYQFQVYKKIRLEELQKEQKSYTQGKQKFANLSTNNTNINNKDKISSTFRVFSRQFSNFVFPPQIKRPMPNNYENIVNTSLNADPQKWSESQKKMLLDIFDGDPHEYEEFVHQYKEYKTQNEKLNFLGQTIQLWGKQDLELPGITSDEEQFIYQDLKIPESYEMAIEQSFRLLKEKQDKYFKNDLNIYGPKMQLMCKNILEGDGSDGPAFVYSQFRTLEGIKIFSGVLEAYGFEPLPYNQINSSNIITYMGQKRYVIYSGDETFEDKSKILWIYNHILNKNGEICKVFLGTSAAAEGISLKNTTQVHIMESYWNEVRIQQAIGRARRICSHQDLPKNKRKVHVYRYHMVFTPKQKTEMGEDETTDQAIYRIAKTKEEINSQFLQILKDAAVDCWLNATHNISIDNPINCFSFDKQEQGISFYPNLKSDTLDKLFTINYKQEKELFADYTQSADPKFYEDGRPLYVYKLTQNSTNPKKETIKTIDRGISIPDVLVLYNASIAKQGNKFEHQKAILQVKSKDGKTQTLILPEHTFTVIDQ